jgi:RNA polymerase sigma-70 factor (family 1)
MTAYSTHTDQELTALLKQGDKTAFAELFDRYHALLLSFALKRTGSIDEAEDAVQEVFIRIWNHHEVLNLVGNTRSYLHRAVINQVLNQFRHMQAKEEHIESFQRYIDVQSDTTDYLVREHVLQEIIEKEIDALPPKMAEVFRLRNQQQLSNREIAEQLGLSEQTVETHMKRALKILEGTEKVFLIFSADEEQITTVFCSFFVS